MPETMTDLTPELRRIAIEAVTAYLAAPADLDGRTPVALEAETDRGRVEIIETKLKPLLARFFQGSVPFLDFKRQVDSTNKQNPLWGFSGAKGQMFFNLLTTAADNKAELEAELKAAARVPTNEDEAAEKLRKFKKYVVHVGEQFIKGGGDRHARPNPGSAPFFISYFWQVQDRDVWPVYYTNTIQMITDMNLWQDTGEVGDDYLSYKRLHETLLRIFSQAAGRSFTLYDVEHVYLPFALVGGRKYSTAARNSRQHPSNVRENLGRAVKLGRISKIMCETASRHVLTLATSIPNLKIVTKLHPDCSPQKLPEGTARLSIESDHSRRLPGTYICRIGS